MRTLVRSEGGVEITGTLKRLSPVPNPEHQRLFNAENATVSADGRVFLTGSTAVYEVINTQHTTDPENITCEYSEVNIIAGEVPKECFRNGITTYGHHVYLACAHVHQWEKSVFKDWSPTLNAISQTRPLNFMWLGLAELCEEVNSYILRANLRNTHLQFDEYFKIPDNCFANGLAANKRGDLYVADSRPGSSCIHKIVWSAGDREQRRPQHSIWRNALPHQLVNGIKCEGDSIYYTCTRMPMWSKAERIDANYSLEPITMFSGAAVLDDFDVAANGLILSNNSDLANLFDVRCMHHGIPNGALIFLSEKGESGTLRDERLVHPSSVKIVNQESKLFVKGDLIIMDKGVDGEYAAFVFTPSDDLRRWLLNRYVE